MPKSVSSDTPAPVAASSLTSNFTPKYARRNTNNGFIVTMWDTTTPCPPAVIAVAKKAGHRYVAVQSSTPPVHATSNSWNTLYATTRGWGAPGGSAPATPKGYLRRYLAS